MYEDAKFKLNINWKSLLIKLIILLAIVFVICFIIFKPNNSKVSLDSNINLVKVAAINYFKDNTILENIGDTDNVSIKKLIKEDYLEALEDEDGNSCTNKNSNVILSKIRDNEYILKVSLKCGKNSFSKVFNLKNKDLNNEIKEEIIDNNNEIIDNQVVDDKEIIEDNKNTKPKEDIKNNDTKKEEVREEKPKRIVSYKHIKYGEWVEGTRYSNSIENSTKEIHYYNYCYNDYCVVDRLENASLYEGYTATFNRTETIPIYRYIYVVWSNSECIKGFINTGIVDYK